MPYVRGTIKPMRSFLSSIRILSLRLFWRLIVLYRPLTQEELMIIALGTKQGRRMLADAMVSGARDAIANRNLVVD